MPQQRVDRHRPTARYADNPLERVAVEKTSQSLLATTLPYLLLPGRAGRGFGHALQVSNIMRIILNIMRIILAIMLIISKIRMAFRMSIHYGNP
jgi:hypothetical protein